MDIFQFCSLKFDDDNRFAWAESENNNNVFQVFLGDKPYIDFKDSGYDWGICGNHNKKLYGDKLDEVFDKFMLFARDINAEREFNSIAGDYTNKVVSDLTKQAVNVAYNIKNVPELGDKESQSKEFVDFLEKHINTVDFSDFLVTALHNNFGVVDIDELDCYDDACQWCTAKEDVFKDEINDVITDFKGKFYG